MPAGFMRQKYYSPTEVGFNLGSIDSAADGNYVACDGYDRFTVYCFHDYAAATGVEFYLEVKDDQDVGHYVTVQTDGGSGVYTLNKWKIQYTTGADAYWEVYVANINAKYLRLADVLGQGSPSGDTFKASILFACGGG